MMTERVKMRYVSCPSCGKQLFKVAGNCSVEITCVRCKKEIVGVVDEIYMKIFENCRGKEHDQDIGKYPHNLSLVQIVKNIDMCWVSGFIWKKSR